jgi:hypothetical protein
MKMKKGVEKWGKILAVLGEKRGKRAIFGDNFLSEITLEITGFPDRLN